MYEFILACCRRALSHVYHPPPTASTAQYSTVQSTRATSSKARTRPSERDNAGKQTELARASMSSSIYTARCVLKTNEEIKICSANKNMLAWWCDARRVCPYIRARVASCVGCAAWGVLRGVVLRAACTYRQTTKERTEPGFDARYIVYALTFNDGSIRSIFIYIPDIPDTSIYSARYM